MDSPCAPSCFSRLSGELTADAQSRLRSSSGPCFIHRHLLPTRSLQPCSVWLPCCHSPKLSVRGTEDPHLVTLLGCFPTFTFLVLWASFTGVTMPSSCVALVMSHSPCGLSSRPAVPPQDIFLGCCCCSVAKSGVTLCDPMGYSTLGFPVLHCLPEFAQIHIHWVIHWCFPTISSSAAAFAFGLQSYPASGFFFFFPMSWFFISGDWSIRA